MKKIKNLLKLLLCMGLIISLTSGIHAVSLLSGGGGYGSGGNGSYGGYGGTETSDAKSSYTITVAEGDNHTYSVYQIMTGSYADGTLGDAKWGQNCSDGYEQGEKVEESTLNYIQGKIGSSDKEIINEILNYVDLQSTAYGQVSVSEPLENVTPGYYIIVDNGVAGEQSSLYIISVVKDLEIERKIGDLPTVYKKVDDINDSNTSEDAIEWQDSADHDIGDHIQFKYVGTLPTNFDEYNKYYYEFYDTMTHLTYDAKSTLVYAKKGDQYYDVSGYFTTIWNAETKTLRVFCEDLHDNRTATKFTADTEIIVYYSATLDDDANIGSAGNPNTVKLIYSNNPNEGTRITYKPLPGWVSEEPNENPGPGGGKTNEPENPTEPTKPSVGETAPDTVIVFTYQVIANKYANSVSDSTKLVGASFRLEKKLANGLWKDLGTIDGTELSTFTWKGIDDGDYRITETVTPTGYNTIDPIEFTVVATHQPEADMPELTYLSGDSFTGNVTTGQLTQDIINNSGATLPSTGGMGTTMIYIGGVSLMAVAAILLISKKRMAIK